MATQPSLDELNSETQGDCPGTAQFDVLVVGTGAAGLYAALSLPDSLQIGLITKDTLSLSASDWAQGGIAAAIAPEDRLELHVEDTLHAGAGLCDREAVEFLVREAPDCVQSLVELGVAFDRQGDRLALTLEAAHSRRRVLHAADTTGRAVVSTLAQRVLERARIQVLSQAFVLDLWLDPETGRCQGASLAYRDRILWVRSQAVILATGGGGQVFSQTTNPTISTGDGIAIGWRAGAVLRDLEFVQFHPTALTKAGAPRFLISEAVRGEGAHLLDRQGHRFAFDYHANGELAPRDVVSRAIFMHLQKTAEISPETEADDCVWLDLSPIAPETIQHRFPNIIRVCQQWGVDVFREPIPVAPAAHYWMGGIETDLTCQTSIPGAYAVGETASTGVHGANRLASNSLLECIVFGAQLARIPCQPSSKAMDLAQVIEQIKASPESPAAQRAVADWSAQQATIATLREELPKLVWHRAGICRDRAGLEAGIAQVNQWRETFRQLPLSQFLQQLEPGETACLPIPNLNRCLRDWGELGNLLDIAYLILRSAAFRTESRGGHYRVDYPQTNPALHTHTLVQGETWQQAAEHGQ